MKRSIRGYREYRGDWPILMACANCGHPGARIYPYPIFEDAGDFETGNDELRRPGGTIGTLWCPSCSPFWGEYLLQQMVILSIRRQTDNPLAAEPSVPLLGGAPVEQIGFLESELADFLDGPGPLSTMRPHWLGEGPIAPRSEAFIWACADLVSWMRDARLSGALFWRNNNWTTLPSAEAA